MLLLLLMLMLLLSTAILVVGDWFVLLLLMICLGIEAHLSCVQCIWDPPSRVRRLYVTTFV